MTSNGRRRVVVTGYGAITDLGDDAPSLWEGLKAGRSGVGPITAFPLNDQWLTQIAGEVHGWDPAKRIPAGDHKRMDRFSLLGLYAALEAAEHCGIDFQAGDPYRRGVVFGSGIGGIITIEMGHLKLLNKGPQRLSPFNVPKLMSNAGAGNISLALGLKGVNSSPATACASGGHAIAEGLCMIQRGNADVMVCGGGEAAVSTLCIGSFSAMKALSTRNDDPTRASRPFDRDRDGFVLAEGAAALILEEESHARARGAEIYAEVHGFGITGDAHHIAAPDPVGTGARVAMEHALADAGLSTTDIDYINAHGTSTPLGDAAEVAAVKELFGDHAKSLAMSSTKSMTGHALGAAGGIESVAVINALREGVLPPTINLDDPDEGFDLDFVANEAQERPIRYALNNSFGFGGHNVSLVFGRYES
ncbi:MAG: beta-ketoacyl-[acyl-carrier-protein] synthase II [Phycisphaerae bacterium]|nr:beta-ketoacyl-[acyl-carrier-protein] synthase II [Phycisphaerae bacterium]MDG1899099.1 beta-ketoacyl-ACP synthase II [Phycisphaerales bacterium]|tara:strand:+ start:2215 stop:3471 length:1257 start_codon:yes stop_codon:yes gene_type:complete